MLEMRAAYGDQEMSEWRICRFLVPTARYKSKRRKELAGVASCHPDIEIE